MSPIAPTLQLFFTERMARQLQASPRSRNTRLAALRSLFGYAALRHPEHAELIRQVLAIPQKRFDKTTVPFLNPEEVSALLGAPDLGRWEGQKGAVRPLDRHNRGGPARLVARTSRTQRRTAVPDPHRTAPQR